MNIKINAHHRICIDTVMQRLDQLELSPDDAIVVGSSTLAALGIRDGRDIDLLVPQSTFDGAAAVHSTAPLTRYNDGTHGLVIGDTELMTTWLGETFTDIYPRAITIEGIRFLALKDLRNAKRQMGRSKDIEDLVLIDTYLRDHPDAC